jgi:hypothetical protein
VLIPLGRQHSGLAEDHYTALTDFEGQLISLGKNLNAGRTDAWPMD